MLSWVCVGYVMYGLNGICRVKGCYGSWVMCVGCVVFPELCGECVELGSIKCGAFKYGVFRVRSLGCSVRTVLCCMECGCGACVNVGVLYLGESKKEWGGGGGEGSGASWSVSRRNKHLRL